MIYYAVLFFLSCTGMLVVARKNRSLFYESNFSQFMVVLGNETANLWHIHLRERSFTLLEKNLRAVRIWFLKMENRMLRMLNLVRGIKEKNSNTPE